MVLGSCPENLDLDPCSRPWPFSCSWYFLCSCSVLDSFSKTLPLGFTALAMHLTILSPRLHAFQAIQSWPRFMASWVPSDVVLTHILGRALRYRLLTYAQGFMHSKRHSLKTNIQDFLSFKRCSLIPRQGLSLWYSLKPYTQGFIRSKQRSTIKMNLNWQHNL